VKEEGIMVTVNEQFLGGEGERMKALKDVSPWNLARALFQHPVRPAMTPTVYVDLRRGETLTYEDVIARRV
jgi:hypothetical protein